MKFAKKSLGQNYLIDKNIIKKIIDLVKIKNRNIIEIGPGKGALTDEILKRKPKTLSIIEKDKILYKNLKIKYISNKLVTVYNADILKFDIENIVKDDTSIFGNLPYNISSQILVNMIKFNKWPPKYKDLIFMFQKELGDKIIGKFHTSNYGRLSILSNFKLKIIEKFNVSANCFFPKPKVTSLVLHVQPKENDLFKIKDLNNLEKVTNILFSNKRKMINKNITKLINKNMIKGIKGINLKFRPSEIEPEIYYKIAELFEAK
ncbi:16S rRNA (adenine(1518)-N(6)/adenine(1519)-N(6))-dimethyltransferase RsmA [Pelagibacteraceae bacterium]|nr:16S rRNA (adenine(1518)-N(6)/adenine(1519)-N(6))-dimethyltransferase RsmA [Pelagibacteraceae bacterium]